MKLREKFDKVVDEYVTAFEKKNDCELLFWVGDDKTGIASFGDTWYVNLHDIIFDVDNDLPKGLIFQWQDDTLEAHYKDRDNFINYQSYSSGLRYADL